MATACISLGAALFLAELGVRALHGTPRASHPPLSRVEANAFRGWQMIPGEAHYTYQHRVHINRFGLRAAELPDQKPAGESRILALGDSTTYGQGVADTATLPAHLESELERLSGRSWRVINAGHRAYGTNQELGLLRELGPALDPDLVILFWYNNDFEEYDIQKLRQELEASGPRTFDIGARFKGLARVAWQAKQVLRHSALVMYAWDVLATKEKHSHSAEYEKAALEHFGQELDDFKAQCAANGWRPAFAVIPHSRTLRSGGESSPAGLRAARVKQAARARDLPVLEMQAPLIELSREMGRAPTIPYDGHYLGIANLRMAQAIAPAVLEL